ncbi:MAG: serine--tRNA ligase [Nanoarchaeota archaeon]|nr:serine--tRNA ligase [Nanoarchaeota archaeon]
MLDIKLIREHPEIVKHSLERRKDAEKISWLMKLIKLDKRYLKLKQNVEELRRQRNIVSDEINQLQKQKKNIKEKIKEIKEIPKLIKETEEKLQKTKQEIDFYMMRLPNILHKSVPYGKDDSENVEIKKWGKIPKFDFELKPHGELIENLEIGNFDKAAEVSGAGFHYMTGPLAHLNLALMQFAVDSLVKKGFKLFIPPLMLNKHAYEGVTDLADFENVMYKIEDEDLYMIATSEHPIAAYLMNEVIQENKLPLKIVGLSPCFRKEIGSRGIDTKGLFRTHQFWKVEQFIFCKPEDSWKYHEELQRNSEELYEKIGIPYRVVNICTGDIGIIAAKKYDIEAYFPRQKNYKEVGSNSNCTDYQARRLKIKYLDKKGKRALVHTLNNTAIATSRTIVAILENYQQKDGSVKVPEVLQKYAGFKTIKRE